jgi:AcrR family transcriptional regulator
MENDVLSRDPTDRAAGSQAQRSVARALDARRAAYEGEVERLVEAALGCIRETGRLSPKVSDLVRISGLSNKAFYRHFRSRDELLVAVLDRGIELLAGYLEHRMQGASDPRQRIERWLDGMTRQALDLGAADATRPFVLSRSHLAEGFADEVRASEARVTAPLRAALAAARDAGALPAVDPTRDAELLYDLAMGWLQRQLATGSAAEPAEARHLIAFALAALDRGDASNTAIESNQEVPHGA